MAVPTRPHNSTVNASYDNINFDLETCYKEFKKDCLEAESPIYWTASYVFVSTVFITLILNLLAIYLFIRTYEKFKKMLFYWLTLQLLIANIIYCIGLLIRRDTLVIFGGHSQFDAIFLTDGFSLLRSISKCITNFYTQLLPFGILTLALHRFGIFVLSGSPISEGYFITTVIVILWFLVILMTLSLSFFDCLYNFKTVQERFTNQVGGDSIRHVGSYEFSCGSVDSQSDLEIWIKRIFEGEQLVVPCLDILIYIIIVLHLVITRGCSLSQKASHFLLIPTFLLFIVVEGSSFLGIFLLTSKMDVSFALVAGRITNTVDMMAASLIPIIVFATNKEIQQMLRCCEGRERTVTANVKQVVPSSSQARNPTGGQLVRSNTSHGIVSPQHIRHQ